MPNPLPFLHDKKETGVAVEHRMGPEEDPGILAVADDLISALARKDRKGVAMALRSAFELLDSMPHEEGPHLEGEE